MENNNTYAEDFDFQSKVQSSLAGELNETEQNQLFDLLSDNKVAEEDFFFSRNLSKTLKNQEMFAVTGIIGNIIDEEGLPETDENDGDAPQSEAGKGGNNTPPQSSAPKGVGTSVKMWLFGAAAALLVGVGAYTMQQSNTAKANAATWETAKEFMRLEVLGDNLQTETPLPGLEDLDNGMQAYTQKDYKKAAELLGRYYKRTKDENAGLYFSISLLMIESSPVEVEKVLNDISPRLAEPVSFSAEWYLIMAKIKMGKTEEAKAMLYDVKSGSPYREDAEMLLFRIGKKEQERDN